MRSLPSWIATCVVASATVVVGCDKSGSTSGASPDAPSAQTTASAPRSQNIPMAANIPVPSASVENAVNKNHEPPYAGPTGVVEGVVKIKGDPAPSQELKLTAGCEGARPTYDRLFREGAGRVAPDVLVAVTDYTGYVPAKEPAVQVQIKNCAHDRRTVVMTFGQRLEVANLDETQSYIPFLAGVASPAHMVLPPKGQGSPVKLYPLDFGRLALVDEMNRPWLKADVFVLKYATATVTGQDGRFRIEGIPVGKVKVSAHLPSADLTQNLPATVEAGKPTTVEFALEYKKPEPASSASASGSAPPRKAPVLK